MDYHNWKTIYECPCGNFITNGVGKWDSKFFLDEVCYNCGTDKDNFKRLGVGYWVWSPTLFDWFKIKYIFKDKE